MKTAQPTKEAPMEPDLVSQHTEHSSAMPCELVQRLEDASVDPTEVGQYIVDTSVEPTETLQHMESVSAEPLEGSQPTEDVSLEAAQFTEHVPAELTTQKDGIKQKVKVYSIEMKDRIVEVVGSIGDKIVMIKATVYELGSGPLGKVQQLSLTAQAKGTLYLGTVGTTLKAKTAFLQDGYFYITSAVEGRVLYLKAKVAEPIKLCAICLQESSAKRTDPVLKKFKAFYVKVHDGMTDLIGSIGRNIVVIRAKMLTTMMTMKVWTLQSLSVARAVLEGYTSPVLSRAISLWHGAASKVDLIVISIKEGAVRLKCAAGERTLPLRSKLSQGWQAATRTPIALTRKLAEIVASCYGQSCDKLQGIQCSIKDRFLHIFGQFKDRLVVMRISIAEFTEHVQSKSLELHGATCSRVAGACSKAKTAILHATETTRTKAAEAGTNVRSLVANPNARAAAAGGVALGASGAATGFVTGGAVGAVCALPAAFFTFGLSIPVGAMVGAGAGGVVGGSAGTVAGSMAGYKAHKEKDTIGKSIRGAFERAKAQKVKTVDSASNLQAVLTASIRGHIGGTA